MDMIFDKSIETNHMKSIVSLYYDNKTIKWWCWKYDFDKKINLTARTIYGNMYDDESITLTYGFICLDDETIVNVVDLIKSYNRDITIQKIIE